MRTFLIIAFLFLPLSLFAAEPPKHMISFGSTGFSGSASYERFSTSNSSFLKDFNILKSNLSLNYAYRLSERWQLGVFLSHSDEVRDFQTTNGKKGKVKSFTWHYGLSGIYNFSSDFFNSYYSALTLSIFNHEEEFTHGSPYYSLEDDRQAEILELTLGKRFSLKNFNISNISYSPDLTVFVANSHKDFNDDGIDHSTGLIIRLLKFDILF